MGHEVLAIAIAALIIWGFAMATLVLGWKPLRQELRGQTSAVNFREVLAYGVGRRDSRGTGALDVGRVRALDDATELRLRSAARSSGP
jgi:hypothetical protein